MEMKPESHWLEAWWPLFVIVFALIFVAYFLSFPETARY